MSTLSCQYSAQLHTITTSDHFIRFYRVGGTTRVAGFMLAGATALLLVAGTGPISYIREYRFLLSTQ